MEQGEVPNENDIYSSALHAKTHIWFEYVK